MDISMWEDLKLQFRSSKGRPLMTEFFKKHKFNVSQPPLIDFETIGVKFNVPSPKVEKIPQQDTGKVDQYVSCDVSTQVSDECFACTPPQKSTRKKIYSQDIDLVKLLTPKTLQVSLERIDSASSPKKTKISQTSFALTPKRNRTQKQTKRKQSSKISVSASNSSAKKSPARSLELLNHSNEEAVTHENVAESSCALDPMESMCFDDPPIPEKLQNLSKMSDKIPKSPSDNSTPRTDDNNCNPQKETIIFSDEMFNSIEIRNKDFRTKRASYIWNKFFPDNTTKSIIAEKNPLEIHQSPAESKIDRQREYGVPKRLSLPKNNLNRFYAICNHVEQWNKVESLNQKLVEKEHA